MGADVLLAEVIVELCAITEPGCDGDSRVAIMNARLAMAMVNFETRTM